MRTRVLKGGITSFMNELDRAIFFAKLAMIAAAVSLIARIVALYCQVHQ